MHLSRLYIKNYRSIKELDLTFGKGKNVLVGRNNAGKSNIIRAINLILGETVPTYAKSENITENDFYSWKEEREGSIITNTSDDIFIWCELSRDEDEPLDYDEFYKCYGYYVYSENKYSSIPKRISKAELPFNYECIFINENDVEKYYINPKRRELEPLERELDDKYIFAFAFRATKNDEGLILKDMRFLYREDEDQDWILSFKASIRNELLQSAIIPSFRDPQMQLRLSSWSWYGKLMRFLTDDYADAPELKEAFDKVKSVSDRIFKELENKITKSTLDVAFPGTNLIFQFNADNKTDLYKNCVIYIDDGVRSLITEKGSGIQSATIIGLFNYYTRFVNTVGSALLCIEEPEIYLHPHARRVISDRLDDFLENARNQVIITTHSVEFIRSARGDLHLILVRKGDCGTEALSINIDDFKHLLIDNNQNELFFADKVIVCEGFDWFILKAIDQEVFHGELDKQNISVISVGGKDNISKLVKLALKLDIKCFVLADFDYLLRDKSEERKEYGVKAHESILDLGEDFFTQDCIFGAEEKDLHSTCKNKTSVKRTL